MTDTEAFGLARYVNDITYTLWFIFQEVRPPNMLIDWLQPLASDEGDRALLMHEEPLYIAADFLGIDRLDPSFRAKEEKYLIFRDQVLYPERAQVPSEPEPKH